MRKILLLLALIIFSNIAFSQSYQLAVLKYQGGGDWYANPTSLPNLIRFCNENLATNIDESPATIEVGSSEIFDYPFLHMTGHGNVVFNQQESDNLRSYLLSGGFLHIDDNYGMDPFVRSELKKVFPELDLVELPFSHPIYHQAYSFPQGLPKVHEHDNKAPQGLGLIYEGRLLIFYSYESDLGDGWEDAEVHKDSEEIREKALKMGSNMISYVFTLYGDEELLNN